MKLFGVLQHAVAIVSSESSPMSAFLRIFFAFSQNWDRVIQKVGEQEAFKQLFGEGSLKVLQDTKAARINLDGKTTAGRKVDLLDPYLLWCYLVDSFRMCLPLDMQGGPTIVHFNNALE